MKSVLLGMVMVTALACGSDAAELFGIPDAGAQNGGTYEYICPESGWLKTDIDQRPIGEIVVRSSSTAFDDITGGRALSWQQYATSSVGGKVWHSCEAGRAVTIEVRR